MPEAVGAGGGSLGVPEEGAEGDLPVVARGRGGPQQVKAKEFESSCNTILEYYVRVF